MRLSQDITTQLEQALRNLRYGTVQLVVHDAQVVRIERMERIRLEPTGTLEAPQSTTDGHPTTTTEARHGTVKES